MSDITSEIYFGNSQVRNPIGGGETWPWTIKVVENPIADTLGFQITGIPDPVPNVGEEYSLYIKFPLDGRTWDDACSEQKIG